MGKSKADRLSYQAYSLFVGSPNASYTSSHSLGTEKINTGLFALHKKKRP